MIFFWTGVVRDFVSSPRVSFFRGGRHSVGRKIYLEEEFFFRDC